MSDLKVRVKRLAKIMCYLLALFVLGWGFTEYKTIFAGLILGTSISLANAIYTAIKVRQFGKRIAAGLKPGGLGLLTRFSMVALAAMVAIRYSDIFSVLALAVGLFLTPLVLFIDGLAHHFRLRHTRVERGEE